MSAVTIAGDDPRDPSAEAKLTLPETWQVDSLGESSVMRSLSPFNNPTQS